MHKKKIQALVVAGLLTVGVIGGTLAWFTSQDEVTNIFNTGGVDNPDINAGIDVDENFVGPDGTVIKPDENGNSTYPKPVLPGDEFTKEVWVDSEADYDQFVRARIEKSWKIGVAQTTDHGGPALAKDAVVTHYKIVDSKVDGQKEKVVIYAGAETTDKTGWEALDYSKIKLTFNDDNFDNTADAANTDTWYAPTGFNTAWENPNTAVGEWYYYNQILQEKDYTEVAGNPATDKTAHILEKVTFKADTMTDVEMNGINIDNIYKTLRFDVAIKGESVQASNGAAADLGWSDSVPASNIIGYKDGATTENNGTK